MPFTSDKTQPNRKLVINIIIQYNSNLLLILVVLWHPPSNSTCEPMEHQEFVKVWCYTMWCDSNAILCDAIPMRCDAIGLRLQLQLHTATLFFYSSFLSFFLIIIFFAFPGFLPVCVLPSSSYVFKLATNRTEKPINNDSEQQWCLADDSGAVANLLVESMADGGFRFILLVFF